MVYDLPLRQINSVTSTLSRLATAKWPAVMVISASFDSETPPSLG